MLYETSSKDQKRILLVSISMMIAVSVIVLVFTLWMLYRSNFEQQVVPFTTERVALMRRALSNESGWMVGLDYRGGASIGGI